MYTSPDPFITMIRQMCTKDKVVQALYQRTISWSDVPSDDDMLELDDWKSYEKIVTRAKDAYKNHVTSQKKVYTIPQRTKTKKHCNQIASRIPYITLKHRSESTKEIVEEIVHQSPVEYEEPHDSILPRSELAPITLVAEELSSTLTEELSSTLASTLTEELVLQEIVPTKIVEVNKISLSSLYRYVILSLIIILVYRLFMK
jgi:hypothetical protein